MELESRSYIRDMAFVSVGYAAACIGLYELLLVLAPNGLSDGRSGTVYLLFAALAGIFLLVLISRRLEKKIWGHVILPTQKSSFLIRFLLTLGIYLVFSLVGGWLQNFVTDLLLERRYGSFPGLYPDFYSPEYRQLYQTAGAYVTLASVMLLIPVFVISLARQTLMLHREQNNGGQSVWEEEKI